MREIPPKMHRRIKALCQSIESETNIIQSGIAWADNPEDYESLENIKEFISLILDELYRDGPDEVEF